MNTAGDAEGREACGVVGNGEGWEINEGLALRVAAGLVHWVAICAYRVGR